MADEYLNFLPAVSQGITASNTRFLRELKNRELASLEAQRVMQEREHQARAAYLTQQAENLKLTREQDAYKQGLMREAFEGYKEDVAGGMSSKDAVLKRFVPVGAMTGSNIDDILRAFQNFGGPPQIETITSKAGRKVDVVRTSNNSFQVLPAEVAALPEIQELPNQDGTTSKFYRTSRGWAPLRAVTGAQGPVSLQEVAAINRQEDLVSSLAPGPERTKAERLLSDMRNRVGLQEAPEVQELPMQDGTTSKFYRTARGWAPLRPVAGAQGPVSLQELAAVNKQEDKVASLEPGTPERVREERILADMRRRITGLADFTPEYKQVKLPNGTVVDMVTTSKGQAQVLAPNTPVEPEVREIKDKEGNVVTTAMRTGRNTWHYPSGETITRRTYSPDGTFTEEIIRGGKAGTAGDLTGARTTAVQAQFAGAMEALEAGERVKELINPNTVGGMGAWNRAYGALAGQFPGWFEDIEKDKNLTDSQKFAAALGRYQAGLVKSMKSDAQIAEPERKKWEAMGPTISIKESVLTALTKLAETRRASIYSLRESATALKRPIPVPALFPGELLDLAIQKKISEKDLLRYLNLSPFEDEVTETIARIRQIKAQGGVPQTPAPAPVPSGIPGVNTGYGEPEPEPAVPANQELIPGVNAGY